MRIYLGGDHAAFEVLYRRHSGRVYGYLRKKLSDRGAVDEVFQNTFLKFHQTRRNYDSSFSFAQWLFVIARTTLFDYFRKQGRQVSVSDEPIDEERLSQDTSASALSELGSEQVTEAMSGALRALPKEQRQAIELRVLEERSYEEIAAALGRSEVSVRQMVSRGLKKLRLFRGES